LAEEKVEVIFKKVLDGIEEKREQAVDWLCDYGDQLVDDVIDKSDGLLAALRTLAANRVADMEDLQAAVTGRVDAALAEAQAEIARLKADAADAVTEKRKEVMYKIKDLKLEIGTAFHKGAKAEKKAQIESQVSELESFINKTIRDYDEAVADQIALVQSATSAAQHALEAEREEAGEAFGDAKGPAAGDLDNIIDAKTEDLEAAFEEKNEEAMEVHTYLINNYSAYLSELLEHILDGSSMEDRDYLLATALAPDTKTPFLSEVLSLNNSLNSTMTKKLKKVKDEMHNVKGGRNIQHKHLENGRIAKDLNGNPIILAPAIEGFNEKCLQVGEKMDEDLEDVVNDQEEFNKTATAAAGDADEAAGEWLDEATHNELGVLADFLEKGFAFHVDTSDFVQHTANPYAPFSTGAYNELVDQINGFEQFFHYWKRTRERAIDTLATCKTQEKASVSAEVFEVDIPALEQEADGLLIGTSGAEHDAQVKAEGDLSAAKAADTAAREALESKLNTGKAKIFREIGFQVKKLYRATREEYKERIKTDLEEAVETFNLKLTQARAELVGVHDNTTAAEKDTDRSDKQSFKSEWVSGQLSKFDDYDQEVSPDIIRKLEWFRDDIMDDKIATARAEIEAGLTKKERDIKAAYEAVKLSLSKIDDHHFQYNVRSLLEDAKGEADRRCAHEEHDTHEVIDGIEQWVWDFVEESIARFEGKVTAERAALAEGLNAAADRVWEGAAEHGDILAEHQEHEKTALEFFLKDCVKGLKHLFNRYGYVSPAFAAVEHQHGYGQPHAHVAGEVDASKLVATLGPNGKVDKPKPGSHPVDALVDDEERSSCTGSSCANPLEIDHHHDEIQLDSLEELAHVIDDEIIHRGDAHEHVPTKHHEVREYEPFIKQEVDETVGVDVAPVHAPTKEELEKPVEEHDHYSSPVEHLHTHEPTPYKMPERPAYVHEEMALPTFTPVAYKKPAPKAEEPHYVRPEEPEAPVVYAAPVQPAPKPVHSTPSADEDVWGNYLAAWNKPRPATSYAAAKPAAEGAWKPAAFQPFDVSKYLLRGRETKPTGSYAP